MTSVALIVLTDGRQECIERSIPAALENLVGLPIARKVICDDSGDREYGSWLAAAFPDFDIVASGQRSGYAAAVRRAWSQALSGDEPWVFWLEDDFITERPVDLSAIASVMDANPQLTQMVLMRQPWYGNEVAAGGIIQCCPEEFTDRYTDGYPWVEHTRGYWSNPHLVRREFLAQHEWPTGSWSESKFSRQVIRGGKTSGYWGARTDAPLVTHVGERRGTGY